MPKDAQLLVRLQSEQKERWRTHVEENGQYRDMTDLVEQAVEDRITEDTDEFSLEDDFELLFREFDEVKEQNNNLKKLNEKIERTQAKSEQLENAMERILNKIDREEENF